MPGYIYLIMMADGVYKVGRTFHKAGPRIRRLEDYPGDSRTIYVRYCEDEKTVESVILKECRSEFGVHLRGKEYFVGPEKRFIDIISKHIDGSDAVIESLLDSTDSTFRINIRGFIRSEDFAAIKCELGCQTFSGDSFYWRVQNTEHKVKTIFNSDRHFFKTVIYTRSGTPLRYLVDVMRALESRKYRVLSTEGFTWIDNRLIICSNQIERPRTATNSVDDFIMNCSRLDKGSEYFAPLELVKIEYANYCERTPAYFYDFEEHCGLSIEKVDGDVTWKPSGWGKPRVFKSPFIVKGLTLMYNPED